MRGKRVRSFLLLDEIAREGARRMLIEALRAEADDYVERHRGERRSDCETARVRFEAEYQAKYPKAMDSLSANWERLVSFFHFPAEHWKHLRTTNVIESPFATVRLRERATRGAGSRTKGLLMAFKLLDMAQLRWRRLDGAGLLPLVLARVKFVDGVQKREENATQPSDNARQEAA
jgi:hypothetical protein